MVEPSTVKLGIIRFAKYVIASLLVVLPAVSAAEVTQGRFTYDIPIKVPRGAHGMQPNLSLTYDSGKGNDIVGMGWSLTGLSHIARVNYGSGINYDGTDTYAHSDLGILVKQPDGSYRSKKESFTKFVPHGTYGDGPCYWVAYDRTGAELMYGTALYSTLLRPGNSGVPGSIRMWALAKVVDLFFNAYTVSYINDPIHQNQRLYPSQIDYTFSALRHAIGTPDYYDIDPKGIHRSVQLQYELRQDMYEHATPTSTGETEVTRLRLKWIIVMSGCQNTWCGGGTLVRKYRLDYQCGAPDPTNPDPTSCAYSETNRSRLTSVTEYGSDGTSTLPPQAFAWQQKRNSPNPGPPPFSFTDAQSGAGFFDTNIRLADLNGDGLPDAIQAGARAWINNGKGGWEESIAFTPPANAVFSVVTPNVVRPDRFIEIDGGLRLVDLNGDGLPDLIQGFKDTSGVVHLHAWLNNGGRNCPTTPTPGCAWTEADQFAPPTHFAGVSNYITQRYVEGYDNGLRIADLDGDGLPDLIQSIDDGALSDRASPLMAWLNTGGKSCPTPPTPGCAWSMAPNFAPPTGTFFVGRDKSTASNKLGPYGHDEGLRLVDLNGDGKPDLIQCWVDGLPNGAIHTGAWLNTGRGWVSAPNYIVPANDLCFAARDASAPNGYDTGVRIVDLNGDGKADLILATYDEHGIYNSDAWLNTGSGWLRSSGYKPPCVGTGKCPFFAARDTLAGSGFDGGLRLIDINGDGKPDLLWGWYFYFLIDPNQTLGDGKTVTYNGAWINTGNGWSSNQFSSYFPGGTLIIAGRNTVWPPHPEGWDPGVRFADINGDGRPELVKASTGNPLWAPGSVGTLQYADLQEFSLPNTFPDLMTSVNNGLGGTITVTYTPIAQVPGALTPTPGETNVVENLAVQQLVTRVVISDGVGGSYATTYQYADARWHPGTIADRRNLGFSSITVTDGQTGQYTKTTYNQEPVWEGHPAETDTFTSANQLVTRTTYTYGLPLPPANGTELVQEHRRSVLVYEPTNTLNLPPQIPVSTQTTATSYDSFGNVTSVVQEATNLPTVATTITYDNDPTNFWVLGKVTEVKVTSGSDTLTDTKYVWDGNFARSKLDWYDYGGGTSQSYWIETKLDYYGDGDLASVLEPLPPSADGVARQTTVKYDDQYKAYPAIVTNALHQFRTASYTDAGELQSVTDPNGAVVR
jgi:hypothetical protein